MTTALFPGGRTMVATWMTARLLDVTSLTVVGIVLPAEVRTAIRGQPRKRHEAWDVLRKTIFQARFPIPRSGSPSMAAGMVMLRSAA